MYERARYTIGVVHEVDRKEKLYISRDLGIGYIDGGRN